MSHYRFIGPSIVLAFALAAPVITGQSQSTAPPPAIGPFDSLHFRPLGPASMSGRSSGCLRDDSQALKYGPGGKV